MARGPLGMDEILESVGMVGRHHLDIRTVTLGINLRGCRTPDDVIARITETAGDLVPITDALASETGIPIVNRRIAVTPIAWVAERPEREELLDLVEMEVRELLDKYDYPGDDAKVVRGASFPALQTENPGRDNPASKCIFDLMDAIDEAIPAPEREVDKPFLMPVEDVFSIEGRGTVATGRC